MEFDFTSDRPIYLQLVEQLELYIISGQAPPGNKLPSVRDLALQAKVNPNTMQRALVELEELGLVYTERTTGKYVTEDVQLINAYREKFATDRVKNYLIEMSALGFDYTNALQYLKLKGEKFRE